MSVSFKINRERQLIAKMQEATEAGLVACALQVQSQARVLRPPVTGRLRDSITFKTITKQGDIGSNAQSGDGLDSTPIEGEAIIGTNVFYAPFVELGTSRQRPRSYLRAALDYVKKDLPSLFKSEYDKKMK